MAATGRTKSASVWGAQDSEVESLLAGTRKRGPTLQLAGKQRATLLAAAGAGLLVVGLFALLALAGQGGDEGDDRRARRGGRGQGESVVDGGDGDGMSKDVRTAAERLVKRPGGLVAGSTSTTSTTPLNPTATTLERAASPPAVATAAATTTSTAAHGARDDGGAVEWLNANASQQTTGSIEASTGTSATTPTGTSTATATTSRTEAWHLVSTGIPTNTTAVQEAEDNASAMEADSASFGEADNASADPAGAGAGASREPRVSHDLRDVLNFPPGHPPFENANMSRCALVGASSVMAGSKAGADIDGYDVVIRVNRIPNNEYYEDFGNRTDVLFVNTLTASSNDSVSLMRGGADAVHTSCRKLPGCQNAAVIVRGDWGCDLNKLAAVWGLNHTFIGCTHDNVSQIAYGMKRLNGYEPSSGFQAFLAFLPLCRTLDLFGFGGVKTADGHIEWERHALATEHEIQDFIIDRRWGEIEWNASVPEAASWIEAHAGTSTKKVGKMP